MRSETMQMTAGVGPRQLAVVQTATGKALPMVLLTVYLIIEYGRPTWLAPLKPGLVLQALLVMSLASQGVRVRSLFRERYFLLYVGLLGFMCLHVLIAVNNYWAFICLKTMFSYLIISLACCVYLDSARRLRTFLFAFVLVLGLCGLNWVLHANLLGISGKGVFGDENDFALAMNVALPIGFFLSREEKGWKKWLLWGTCIVLVLGNISCSSRGGVIGLVAVGGVCWWFMKQKLPALMVLVAVAMLAWSFAPPDFREELSGIGMDSADKDTGKDRIELWKTGWRAFADNPLLGVGQGNIPIVINRYQYDKAGVSYWKRDMWGRALHSVYMTLLSELGLVGTVLVLIMLRELVRKFKKTRQICRSLPRSDEASQLDNLNRAVMTSFFGFLVTGIFLSVFYYPPLWNIAALFMALHLTASRLQQTEGKDSLPAGRPLPRYNRMGGRQ